MTQGPSDRRYKDAGFVGHMHRFTNGKTYDEFNQEWVVSTTTKDNSGDFDDACVQAFGRPNKRKRVDDDDGDDAWRCRCVPKPCASLARCRGKVDHLIVAAVDATAHAGTTVRDLVAKIVLPGGSLSVDEMQGRVNHLLAVEKLWDVHAYAEVRYVTKKHAGLWFVHPFAKDGCHVEFNRDEPALARPWLKMDERKVPRRRQARSHDACGRAPRDQRRRDARVLQRCMKPTQVSYMILLITRIPRLPSQYL
ncbi:Aste57867_17083 [Aphanomyces stellatus]|uniref:Aste57867_17083 protein n=1 Tax=Aphanomyces stellatus TaxID=120398 RepID=A0A485L7Q9_9STRA|nr:hypothetical protein As57867_017025 [Aphanomyces stellatus]VFT93843.1 Aste57867_17083 [Aphanomyces stellatus]